MFTGYAGPFDCLLLLKGFVLVFRSSDHALVMFIVGGSKVGRKWQEEWVDLGRQANRHRDRQID